MSPLELGLWEWLADLSHRGEARMVSSQSFEPALISKARMQLRGEELIARSAAALRITNLNADS